MWQSCRAVRIQRVRIPDETKAKRAPETIKGFTFTIFFLPREGSRGGGGGGTFSEREVAECPRSAIPLFFPSVTKHSPSRFNSVFPFFLQRVFFSEICIEIQSGRESRVSLLIGRSDAFIRSTWRSEMQMERVIWFRREKSCLMRNAFAKRIIQAYESLGTWRLHVEKNSFKDWEIHFLQFF